MIKPNMATMLSYVFTDANLSQPTLDRLLREQVAHSFNRITVDGDTSTNDCCLLSATCLSAAPIETETGQCHSDFVLALRDVFSELAVEIIKDAEGATKFVTVAVNGGQSSQECLQVGYTVAESPLVKTALFASDPNWGRILAAIGRAGLDNLDINAVEVWLGDTRIVAGGCRDANYTEEAGQAEMDKDEITISISLARGENSEKIFTADLSYDYVRINADYRS
jgi:glutamate N-acetyltransferase/amino-acid N-acetyltransferase